MTVGEDPSTFLFQSLAKKKKKKKYRPGGRAKLHGWLARHTVICNMYNRIDTGALRKRANDRFPMQSGGGGLVCSTLAGVSTS